MEISIKWNLCRVCLQEEPKSEKQTTTTDTENKNNSKEMKSIFSDEKLPQKILDCSGVEVLEHDGLPDKICVKCLLSLKHAVYFRSMCRGSNEYLQEIMQRTRTASTLFKPGSRKRETAKARAAFIESDDFLEDFVDISKLLNDKKPANSQFKKIFDGKVYASLSNSTVVLNPTISQPAEQNISLLKKGNLQSVDSLEDDLNEDECSEKNIIELLQEVEVDLHEENVDNDNTVTKANSDCGTTDFETLIDEVDDEQQLTAEDDNSEHKNDTKSINENDKITSIVVVEEEDAEAEDNDEIDETELREDVDGDVKALRNILTGDTESTNMDGSYEETDYFYIINDETSVKEEYAVSCSSNTNEMDGIELLEISRQDDEQMEFSKCEYVEDELVTNENRQEAEINEQVVDDKSLRRVRRRFSKPNGSYDCDICGNHFHTRTLMNCHMRTHRNEKNYECELCGKRFNAGCNLTAHMRVHTGEKPFQCHYCDRRFADRSTHIKHERIHTNEKPFSCSTCGKAFTLSTTLKAHEKIHTGEKPFRCAPCARSFKLPHQLKAHKNTHLHRMLTGEQNVQISTI